MATYLHSYIRHRGLLSCSQRGLAHEFASMSSPKEAYNPADPNGVLLCTNMLILALSSALAHVSAMLLSDMQLAGDLSSRSFALARTLPCLPSSGRLFLSRVWLR